VKGAQSCEGITFIHISFRENQEHVKRMMRHIWWTKNPLNIVQDLLFSKKSRFKPTTEYFMQYHQIQARILFIQSSVSPTFFTPGVA
jgi:hypothetical protein